MKLKGKMMTVLLSSIVFTTGAVNVSAADCCSSQSNSFEQRAVEMMEKYDSMQSQYESDEYSKIKEKTNSAFVNPMKVKQEETQSRINEAISKAKSSGEKCYTYEEILQLDSTDLDISDSDLAYIKSCISGTVEEYKNIYESMVTMGEQNHPLARNLKNALEMQYPASLIYVSHDEIGDGHVSGGGWPYCLDDNGWGPANFLNSDCQWAFLQYGQCLRDHIGNFVGDPSIRYCQAYKRNCSPLIGHSKYWHTH